MIAGHLVPLHFGFKSLIRLRWWLLAPRFVMEVVIERENGGRGGVTGILLHTYIRPPETCNPPPTPANYNLQPATCYMPRAILQPHLAAQPAKKCTPARPVSTFSIAYRLIYFIWSLISIDKLQPARVVPDATQWQARAGIPVPIYISQWERIEFLFQNSGKTFLGFMFTPWTAEKVFW